MIRIIVGPPASGKSTLVDRLRCEGTMVFGVRSRVQQEIEAGTPRGRIAMPFVTAQKWLPDWLVVEAAMEAILQESRSSDILLEGLPATAHQAKLLDDSLAEHGLVLGEVVHLHAPDHVLLARARERRVCEACDHGSHPAVLDPDGRCVRCGGPTSRRLTDHKERFEARLTEHARNSKGLIEYFAGRQIISIDTSALSSDEVWDQFVAQVKGGCRHAEGWSPRVGQNGSDPPHS